MIDPLRTRTDALARAVSNLGVGTAAARIIPLPGVRPDELSALLARGRQLSPAQSQQIVALLRATLESFAAPVPTGHAGGSVGAFQAAQVSLGRLQEDLGARLTRLQDQTRTLAPILNALLDNGTTDAPSQTTTRPGSATTTPGAASLASLAEALAGASTRLEETLGSAMLRPAASAHDTAPPNAFRWLHDAARTLPAETARPVVTPGEVVRLTSLAHALADALATPMPANTLPKNRVAADAEDAFPLQSDLFVALDRHPGVASLVTPILRELGLAAANVQLAPGSVSAEVFAAALARVRILAVIVLAEAGGLAAPGVYRELLATCAAAGMPPFTVPLDSADNIETYRWLLIAAQLYNSSRVAPRPPLLLCHRCGRKLRPSRSGIYYCPYCS